MGILRDLFFLAFIFFIIIPLWFIAAGVEVAYMWLRGYSPDKDYGGYYHRKTGQRIPSAW